MADVLDLGEVEIPDWSQVMNARSYIPFREVAHRRGDRAAFLLHDIAYVRSCVRRRRYGEAYEPSHLYRVQVSWPNGETATWEFDHTVGWPTEDGKARDWRGEWMQNFGGVA